MILILTSYEEDISGFLKYIRMNVRRRIISNFKKDAYNQLLNKLNNSDLIKFEFKKFNLSIESIFNYGLRKLIWTPTSDNRYELTIDNNYIYPGTDIKLINLIKLFEYGTTYSKPILLFREAFSYYQERLFQLYREYKKLRGI